MKIVDEEYERVSVLPSALDIEIVSEVAAVTVPMSAETVVNSPFTLVRTSEWIAALNTGGGPSTTGAPEIPPVNASRSSNDVS